MTFTPALYNGNTAAWRALCGANETHIFYLCTLLTCDEAMAKEAALAAFRDCFARITEGKLNSEEEFAAALEKKAILGCRDRMQKKDSKVFALPVGKNLSLSPDSLPEDLSSPLEVCRAITPVQRFLVVLGAIGYRSKEVGDRLHLSASTVETVLSFLPAPLKGDFAANLKREEKESALSENEAFALAALVEKQTAPLKEKAKKKRNSQIWITTGLVALIAVAVALLATVGNAIFTTAANSPGGNNPNDSSLAGVYTDVTVDMDKTYYADITVKDLGTISVKLDQSSAPITVSNFVNLAQKGFYNGLTFHRIMEGFMMQGGDPKGNGTGGADQNIKGEFSLNGVNNTLSHQRGVISMARATPYNSASSQFFIMHQTNTHLDGQYAAFGKVESGMDIVDRICTEAEPTDNNGTIPSSQQPIIESVVIRVV